MEEDIPVHLRSVAYDALMRPVRGFDILLFLLGFSSSDGIDAGSR
jgi:hypothetical protein